MPQTIVLEDFADSTYAFPITLNSFTRGLYQGKNSIYSTNHTDGTTGTANIDMNVPSNAVNPVVYFDYYVSTEQDYDFLTCQINGTEVLKTSGSVGWSTVVYNLPTAQTSSVTLSFSKDAGASAGDDTVGITNIKLEYWIIDSGQSLTTLTEDCQDSNFIFPISGTWSVDNMGSSMCLQNHATGINTLDETITINIPSNASAPSLQLDYSVKSNSYTTLTVFLNNTKLITQSTNAYDIWNTSDVFSLEVGDNTLVLRYFHNDTGFTGGCGVKNIVVSYYLPSKNKIGEFHMAQYIIPIYDISLMTTNNQLRAYHPTKGIGCFELVDITAPNASPLRINTKTGIKAIGK